MCRSIRYFCFCIYIAREVVIQLLGNSSVGGYRHSYATVLYIDSVPLFIFFYVMREEGGPCTGIGQIGQKVRYLFLFDTDRTGQVRGRRERSGYAVGPAIAHACMPAGRTWRGEGGI